MSHAALVSDSEPVLDSFDRNRSITLPSEESFASKVPHWPVDALLYVDDAHLLDQASAAAAALGRELAGRCEGARTPVLLAATHSPAIEALTGREREIAGLAARGYTSREISTRLVLSVRTVNNHLNHVYGKLGIGREDLPKLLNID